MSEEKKELLKSDAVSIESTRTVRGNKKITKKDIEYMRDRDRELVKGIFKFYESRGGSLSFYFKKWPGDPIEKYTLHDGQVHTIPRGLAEHLNKNGWYPEHKYILDENGKPKAAIKDKIRRFGFHGLDFIDLKDIQEERGRVVEVTNI